MSFTGHKLEGIEGLADAASTVLEGKAQIYELVASLTDEDASDFITAAACARDEGKDKFIFNGKEYPVTIAADVAKQINNELDPVGKEDDDIDNDGDVDDSDEYLKKRRDAIDKAIDDEEEQDESLDEGDGATYAGIYKSNDEVSPETKTGVDGHDDEDEEVKDGEKEEEDSEEVKESTEEFDESTLNYARTLKAIEKDRKMSRLSDKDKETLGKIADLMKKLKEEDEVEEAIEESTQPKTIDSVESLLGNLSGISEKKTVDLDEGKMKELHALVSKGIKDPKKITKELGLANTPEVHKAIASLIKGMK